MTPERAIEVLSKLGKPTGGTLNWSKTGQEWCDAVLMGAAALAEVAALRAEIREAAIRLDMSADATFGQIMAECDQNDEDLRLLLVGKDEEVAALRAENEKLKADDLGAIAKQIVEAFITLRRTGLDADRDKLDAMIDDYLEITGAADPKKEGT